MAIATEGDLSGEFAEPVIVNLDFAGSDCIVPSATQQPVGSNSIAVLVELDRRNCKRTITTSGDQPRTGQGLSRTQKIAIGVVCGVVGVALLVMVLYCIVRSAAPDTAVAYVLQSPFNFA